MLHIDYWRGSQGEDAVNPLAGPRALILVVALTGPGGLDGREYTPQRMAGCGGTAGEGVVWVF